MFCLSHGLQAVTTEGTGRSLQRLLPKGLNVAGKTGTTDNLRDSWFAGFAGDYLAVVWLGRDDNASIGMTGSAGALKVWGEFMANTSYRPLDLEAPAGVIYKWIDSETGLLSRQACEGSRYMPFIQGSAPEQRASCKGVIPGVFQWFQRLFE